MALSESDIEEFIALVQKNADLRERVRRALIDGDFARITENLDRLSQELRAFQAQTTDRFAAVDGQLDELNLSVQSGFKAAEHRDNRLTGQVGNLSGQLYEHDFRWNFGAYLGRRFRNLRPIVLANYEPALAALDGGRLSDSDWDDLHRADAIMLVRDRQSPHKGDVLAVVELSRVVDAGDAEPAVRRAGILTAVGLEAVPCVAGEYITAGAGRLVPEYGVAAQIVKPDGPDSEPRN